CRRINSFAIKRVPKEFFKVADILNLSYKDNKVYVIFAALLGRPQSGVARTKKSL
ncbi:MAG: hypothetical protein ACI97P_001265, partial [Arcticibacterium sp.]